jgi:glycosyltransferase involved in cell wall biosynthesis
MILRQTNEPKYNIGFISTRFHGTDGVSLETNKWHEVLEGFGHSCFFFAGLCDKPQERSMVVPEAFYRHPEILNRHRNFYGVTVRSRDDTEWIHKKRAFFRERIHEFLKKFSIDLLIPENCLTIPINIPLGLALTEVIAETGIPTIAHHHDFIWERKRFLINSVTDLTDMAFPPNLPSIQHVVINSIARNNLASTCGISSTIIPNIMNFEHCEVFLDSYSADLRERLGIEKDELFILQPTRIVQRKGIEHAIELVSRLGRKAHLVISHASGDEGGSYADRVCQYAKLLGVDIIFASNLFAEERSIDSEGNKIYGLADAYHHADLVTYPSEYEGFGNAFLEGIYYYKPMVIQHYTVYTTDIAPLGFDMIEFEDFITDVTVGRVREVLDDAEVRSEMVTKNFDLARKYFSYPTARYKLGALISNAFGPDKHWTKKDSKLFSRIWS